MTTPHPGQVVRGRELEEWLERSRDPDPLERVRAAAHLCPCHTKVNNSMVWERILEMAEDPHPRVRGTVLHAMADGSPRELEARIVGTIEGLYHDPDLKLRRRARKLLAHHRRTGKLNVL